MWLWRSHAAFRQTPCCWWWIRVQLKLGLVSVRPCDVVVVLLYGLVCTRLQRSNNIKSCSASRWKSNTDNKTLLLLKWSLHSIIHRKCKTHCRDNSSKVCGCYMARLTLSKNSKSASLTTVLYRLFTLLSHDGDNNSTSVIMELWLCFVIMPEWYIKSNISFIA